MKLITEVAWQNVIVCMALAAAIAYLGRSAWRTWSGGGGSCGCSCKCGEKSDSPIADGQAIIPSNQLQRRR